MAKLKERTNSEDPVPVAVTTSELIVGREKSPQFTRYFYDQIGQFSVELLGPRLEDIVLGFLNSSSAKKNFLEEEIFAGTNFRELLYNPYLAFGVSSQHSLIELGACAQPTLSCA